MKNPANTLRIGSFLLAVVMLITMAACGSPSNDKDEESGDTASCAYAEKLFDTGCVHTVDIEISDDDWADLLANPTQKTKYRTSITIDGETFSDVSFATKGNTSLTAVASDENSDRYSFKVNFGKYVDGQTYYGLNKLNLNNIYADATYMKDYLSYEIFRQAGVESPLVSYVWLTINGKDHGLYLAIEDVSESYLNRTRDGEGELYKPETEQFDNMRQPGGATPDSAGMPGDAPQGQNNGDVPGNGEMPAQGQNPGNPPGNGAPATPQMQNGDRPELPSGGMTPPGDFDPNSAMNGEMPTMPEGIQSPEMPQGDADKGNAPGGGMGFDSDAKGADLKYTDDKTESYSDIFDNDETDADEDSNARVIAALKALSQGGDLDTYLDTDEIIRYFAAHNFVLSYDSYTGNMLHNYYLYEKDGRLSMLPWDYNLAFGAFGGEMGQQGGQSESDATSLINTGIDTPLSGAQESDRPMWSWIASNETYLEQYHAVYDELLRYFESGDFDKEAERIFEMIQPYVAKDPSAFYTEEEFEAAASTLKDFCRLRAESIRKQLDGSLSSKTSEQKDADRVDASSVVISTMGMQNHGKGGQEMTPPQMPAGGMPASESATEPT